MGASRLPHTRFLNFAAIFIGQLQFKMIDKQKHLPAVYDAKKETPSSTEQ
jgi:hypothetical protein